MTIFSDVLKFVVAWAILWLLLCVSALLLVGSFDRTMMLLIPRPKLPVMLLLVILWGASGAASYWYSFQRYTFYSGAEQK